VELLKVDNLLVEVDNFLLMVDILDFAFLFIIYQKYKYF
jgi:hypothetical protein